ncbi:MAG TPA: NADP-dependent glyceraldehyde-3-phosphate dehydrogenase, partial [Firmicutes bacterium]|nr:NADP-dependent glyceraldehyde-3-phosphate dehydrogenase [Bacillota bacterium]
MSHHYQYYVNGVFKESSTNDYISIYSPYNEALVGSVPALSVEEIDDMIACAKSAQKAWAQVPIRERASYLFAWADELLKSKHDIATTIMHEVGKGYNDAIKEVERTADLIRFTVEEALHMYGESLSGEHFPGGSSSKVALVNRVPLGVILAISPFNYPVNLSAAKIAPALITGNAVIFKPATVGAISGIKMIEALHQTNLPPGVLNLVTGKGSVIGDYITKHPGINMISFTGGTTTGQSIASKAKMVPMVMELGGKDPAIVLDDANFELVAKEIVSGAFSYSGQRCTAIKRVLVDDNVADVLIELIVKQMKQLKVGSPEDNATIVPLIDTKSADYVQSLIDESLEKGAKLIVGNKRENNLLYPTLIDHVTVDMQLAWEEPFGPVLPIIRVHNVDEAIEIANQSDYGLQASVFTTNMTQAFEIARKLEAGSVQINGRTERGPDHFPFIGVKNSGVGVQGIKG